MGSPGYSHIALATTAYSKDLRVAVLQLLLVNELVASYGYGAAMPVGCCQDWIPKAAVSFTCHCLPPESTLFPPAASLYEL